jgi:hypothetical protein
MQKCLRKIGLRHFWKLQVPNLIVEAIELQIHFIRIRMTKILIIRLQVNLNTLKNIASQLRESCYARLFPCNGINYL